MIDINQQLLKDVREKISEYLNVSYPTNLKYPRFKNIQTP